MTNKNDKNTVFELVPGPDGNPIPVPVDRAEEEETKPAADGKYYLGERMGDVRLALRLAHEGVEVYCSTCKAPLKVTSAFILCPTDERHFRATVYTRR